MKYWFVTPDEEDEDEEVSKYSNIIEEEDFEEDQQPPEGFEGPQKGSNLEESSGGERAGLPRPWESSGKTSERERAEPVPWDPSESFFAYI